MTSTRIDSIVMDHAFNINPLTLWRRLACFSEPMVMMMIIYIVIDRDQL